MALKLVLRRGGFLLSLCYAERKMLALPFSISLLLYEIQIYFIQLLYYKFIFINYEQALSDWFANLFFSNEEEENEKFLSNSFN
ncbi:MAG: hypothetical protein MUO34_11220 [Ignavibacteriaceae bacterium]|nr:hypothetical protein [Ignavibacteriaceae bacterium]